MTLDFIKDKRWLDLDRETQDKMIDVSFNESIVSDPRWNDFDDPMKQDMKQAYYQQADELEQSSHAVEERGFGGDIVSHLVRGAAQLGELTGYGLKTLDPDSGASLGDRIGQKMIDLSQKAKKYDIFRPDESEVAGEGFVKRGVMSGLESSVSSIAPVLTGTVTGAKLGGLLGPAGIIPGAFIGGTTATVATFGFGTYGQKLEEYKKAGIEEEQAHKAALKNAVIEAGGEEVSNIFGALTFGFGKFATQPLKVTAKELLKTPLKEFAKKFATNTLLNELPTEMVQATLQSKVDENLGLLPEGIWQEAAVETIIPTLTMSVLFSVGAQGLASVRNNQIKNQLNSDDLTERISAVKIIANRIEDKELQDAWIGMSSTAIMENKPIDITADFSQYKASEKEIKETPEQISQAKDIDDAISIFSQNIDKVLEDKSWEEEKQGLLTQKDIANFQSGIRSVDQIINEVGTPIYTDLNPFEKRKDLIKSSMEQRQNEIEGLESQPVRLNEGQEKINQNIQAFRAGIDKERFQTGLLSRPNEDQMFPDEGLEDSSSYIDPIVKPIIQPKTEVDTSSNYNAPEVRQIIRNKVPVQMPIEESKTVPIETKQPEIQKQVKTEPIKDFISPEKLVTDFNLKNPNLDLKYDGIFDRTALKKSPLFQFTPQRGALKGRTILVEDLSEKAIEKKLASLTPKEMLKEKVEKTGLTKKDYLDIYDLPNEELETYSLKDLIVTAKQLNDEFVEKGGKRKEIKDVSKKGLVDFISKQVQKLYEQENKKENQKEELINIKKQTTKKDDQKKQKEEVKKTDQILSIESLPIEDTHTWYDVKFVKKDGKWYDPENLEVTNEKDIQALNEKRESKKEIKIRDVKAELDQIKFSSEEPERLIIKSERDFHSNMMQDIKDRASKTVDKVKEYLDWKYEVGDKVRSNKLGVVYTITGKGWNKKKDEPLYYVERRNINNDLEKSSQFAKKFEEITKPVNVPKDRFEVIKGGKEKFNIKNDSFGKGVSLKEIQETFKNQEVFLNDKNEISVRFKNKKGIIIKQVEQISDEDIKLAVSYGIMSEKGIILGKTDKSEITLNKNFADKETLFHETFHALINLGIISKEDYKALELELKSLIQKRKINFYPSKHKIKSQAHEENLANTFVQVMIEREKYRKTFLGKMIQKVMDFFDGLWNIGRISARKFAKKFESGKIFEREGKENENDQSKFTFLGPNAKTANIEKVFRAQQMRDAGRSREEVWRQTGWWEIKPGSDVWSFELDDSKAKWNQSFLSVLKINLDKYRNNKKDSDKNVLNLKLSEVLNHPELYKNYPFLKNIDLSLDSELEMDEAIYNPKENDITLSPTLSFNENSSWEKAAINILLHEVQHIIQVHEGFAIGGDKRTEELHADAQEVLYRLKKILPKLKNSEDIRQIKNDMKDLEKDILNFTNSNWKKYLFELGKYWQQTGESFAAQEALLPIKNSGYKRYQKLTGEAEARLVQKRQKMTNEERRNEPPWMTLEKMLMEENLLKKDEKPEDILVSKDVYSLMMAKGKESIPMFQVLNESYDDVFSMPEVTTKLEDIDYNIIDLMSPFSKVYKQIKKEIPEEDDFILKERLRFNKSAEGLKKANNEIFIPIKKELAKHDLNFSQADEALYSRHAPEANERLKRTNAKRYLTDLAKLKNDQELDKKISDLEKAFKKSELPTKELHDSFLNLLEKELENVKGEKQEKLKKEWEKNSQMFSGMTTEKANELYGKWKNHFGMQAVLKLHDDMIQKTREISLSSGRISQSEFNALSNTFEFYTPLYREGFTLKKGFEETGKGIINLRKDYKIRGGSTKKAVNMFGNAMIQHEHAIIKAEKARSARAFINLLKNNPNKDFWDIEQKKLINDYDHQGNIVKQEDKSVAPNEIPIKVDGKYYVIWMNPNNVHAMRIVEHLKGNNEQSGAIVNGLAKFNRILSMINTSLNPEFILTNLPRDLQIAFINLDSTEISKLKSQVLKDIPKSIKGLHDYFRLDGQSEWGKWVEEFSEAGGMMDWVDFTKDVESKVKGFEKDIKRYQGKRIPEEIALKAAKLIMDYNSIAENAVRLSAYVNARKANLSKDKAALLSKELTVNFGQRGKYGHLINSLYLFSNAGIQGSVRLLSGLRKSKKAQKLLGGFIMTAIGMAIANSLIAGDDDDGKNHYENINSYDKERNIIIMIPGTGNAIKLPLGWGLNFFWNVGTEIGDLLSAGIGTRSSYDLLEGAGRILNIGLNAFNPIQSATIAQTISPTIFDPVAQILENQTFFGAPLMPEKNIFENVETPDSQRYWSSVKPYTKWAAEFLNEITGGDKIEKGFIDVSPETMDLLIDTLTGGAGKFFGDFFGTLGNVISGDEIEIKDIPMTRKFLTSPDMYRTAREFSDNAEHVHLVNSQIKAFPSERDKYQFDKTYLLKSELQKTNKKLKDLKKIRNLLKDETQKNHFDEKIKKLQNDFNHKFELRRK